MVRRTALAIVAAGVLVAAPAPAAAAVGIVRAQVSLPPDPYLFGQEVTADVDLLVDTSLVDPETVLVRAHFGRFQAVTEPARTVTSQGRFSRIRYRYRLTCDSLGCAAGLEKPRELTFPPALARYETREGKALSTTVDWPPVSLVSRIGDALQRPETATEARQQIPIDILLRLPISVVAPEPTYTSNTRLLAALLFATALAVFVVAAFVARPVVANALASRRGTDTAEVTPFERAVARVETAARREPGSPEHRESLALLARELRLAGLTDLVERARRLAWSEQAPTAAESRELATEARSFRDRTG